MARLAEAAPRVESGSIGLQLTSWSSPAIPTAAGARHWLEHAATRFPCPEPALLHLLAGLGSEIAYEAGDLPSRSDSRARPAHRRHAGRSLPRGRRRSTWFGSRCNPSDRERQRERTFRGPRGRGRARSRNLRPTRTRLAAGRERGARAGAGRLQPAGLWGIHRCACAVGLVHPGAPGLRARAYADRLQALVAEDPTYVFAWACIGDWARAAGDPHAAVKAYRFVLRHNPNMGSAAVALLTSSSSWVSGARPHARLPRMRAAGVAD